MYVCIYICIHNIAPIITILSFLAPRPAGHVAVAGPGAPTGGRSAMGTGQSQCIG